MARIHIKGEDRSAQIADWKLRQDRNGGGWRLVSTFHSGKSFSAPLDQCAIAPTENYDQRLLAKNGSRAFQAIEQVRVYGEKYATYRYAGSEREYLTRLDKVRLLPPSDIQSGPVFKYFSAVLEARAAQASRADTPMIENIQRQLERLPAVAGTALHAYCTGHSEQRTPLEHLIYPFGINASQLKAVENAFRAQVSIIQGPPGTGKTQTILNIIANILLQSKTVAILSNNNPAVENVYEKLECAGLGGLIAKLGSAENRAAFLGEQQDFAVDAPPTAAEPSQISEQVTHLKALVDAKNAAARWQARLDELAIEHSHLQQWQQSQPQQPLPELAKYRLSSQQTSDLLAYLCLLGDRPIGLLDRIRWLRRFGIWRASALADSEHRKSVRHALQLHYYNQATAEAQTQLDACRRTLNAGNFDTLVRQLCDDSMALLKRHLQTAIPKPSAFAEKTYRRAIDDFLARYPVIGSSTHSIVNSIGQGTLLDYAIVDEASQQDIVPGILALGCARNVIIVGDSKQLAHIPAHAGVPAPQHYYDCDRYSLLDSCRELFQQRIPSTLLREHYRCHPRIIQFCNQQFYDNALIPMTTDAGEAPLKLVVTAKGNHRRHHSNQRELDSLLATIDDGSGVAWDADNSRGFMAPYRAQVALSENCLPANYIKDTTHKFQGRECKEVVFSTVVDGKNSSQKMRDFVDDARLINVAVSRAQHKFTLVTGDNVFTADGHIAALQRYIHYYAGDEHIHQAPVVSAFDLLYDDYDQSLNKLKAKLRAKDSKHKSEQIVACLLRDTLCKNAYNSVKFHIEKRLDEVVWPDNPALTPAERTFMDHSASCDFVLYFKVGKQPFGVIEVDGSSHDTLVQQQRDALKDSILAKSGIALLRLKTTASGIEDKLAAFLDTTLRGPGQSTDGDGQMPES